MKTLFVAGSHTDVGKTYVACALIRAARGRGLKVEALKPLVSGLAEDDWGDSDPGRLLTALGLHQSQAFLEAMSPWRFRAPLAPPMAARLEGRTIDLAAVARHCADRIARARADLMLVEGAGGVMSPLSETGTNLDLMKALAAPAIVVGGSYLGGVSHLLTALETLRAHGVAIAAAVLSQSDQTDAPDFHETLESVRRFAGDVALVAAPRDGDQRWAARLLDGL